MYINNGSWIPQQLATESSRLHVATKVLLEVWTTLFVDFRTMYWDWRNEKAPMEQVQQLVRVAFGRDATVREMESGQEPDPGPGLVIAPSPNSAIWLHVAPDTWTVYVPEDGEWTAKDVELVAWLYESLKDSTVWWATTEISKGGNYAAMHGGAAEVG